MIPLAKCARQLTARLGHSCNLRMNETSPPVAPGPDASMHDMLRIMDVASALRRERETAEAVLDVGTAKAKLRDRLLATASAAGEPVTAAEVDAAIEQYFRQQHEYRDPPAGWGRFWANVWVMRRTLGAVAIVLLVAVVGITLLASSMANQFGKPPTPRQTPTPAVKATPAPQPQTVPQQPVPQQVPQPVAELATVWAKFQQDAAAARALCADDDARGRVQRIVTAAEAAHGANDLPRLRKQATELATLVARLDEEYTVTIVSRPGEKSGVDRYGADGRLSGYYLIVEAIAPDGRALRRQIKNAETQSTETVTKWGELVDTAVWERVVADKQADGVVDDAAFARKERGRHDETTVFEGSAGKPLRRGRQITRW